MKNNKSNARQDIYSRITGQIIAALEQGVKPWTQPWNAGHAAAPVVYANTIVKSETDANGDLGAAGVVRAIDRAPRPARLAAINVRNVGDRTT